MIDMLDAGKTLGAHGALGNGLGISFDVSNHAVLNSDQHPATAMATLAGGFHDSLLTHASPFIRPQVSEGHMTQMNRWVSGIL
jgi:hypothetical protein